MKKETRKELLRRIDDCVSAVKELYDFSNNAFKEEGVLSSDDCSCLTMITITANALVATTLTLVKNMMSAIELNLGEQEQKQLN